VKICPAGTKLFHADGQTDGWTDRRTNRHDEANRHFSQFCEHTYKKVKAKQIVTVFNNGKTQVYNSLNTTQKDKLQENCSKTSRKQQSMKTGNKDINDTLCMCVGACTHICVKERQRVRK
jgi:hypothetical protein